MNDPKCLKLAQYVLADVAPEAQTPKTVEQLAEHLEMAIKMFLIVELGVTIPARAAARAR